MEYTGRSVVRASVKNLSPSGSSTNCGNITPGVRKAVWRFQTGQDPPYSAMLKLVALNLLVTFPALSTRKKKMARRVLSLFVRSSNVGRPVQMKPRRLSPFDQCHSRFALPSHVLHRKASGQLLRNSWLARHGNVLWRVLSRR